MKQRHHDDWIAAYMALFDGKTEAPTELHWWTAVSTIAGALTRRVWIDETIFRFYPNFFIVFVAHPGEATKSTAISLGISMLRELDHIYLAADNTTYPKFVEEMAKHWSDIRDQIADDPCDDLWVRQCAVTAAISELGTFFKPEEEDMVNGLTDLWDCRSIMVKETKHSGSDVVEHPFVNLIAGTTPSWVQTKLKAQIGGWGLSSRVIFIHSKGKARYIPRPSKMWATGAFDQAIQSLIVDLQEIAGLNGAFQLSPEADTFYTSWYEEAGKAAATYNRSADADPWVGHFLARKPAHVQKLAMVLSVSRSSSLVIEGADLIKAVEAVDAVQEEIPTIFKFTPEPTQLARTEHDILEQIIIEITNSPIAMIARSDAYKRASRLLDGTSANRMIENAIGRGTFKQLISGGQSWLKLP